MVGDRLSGIFFGKIIPKNDGGCAGNDGALDVWDFGGCEGSGVGNRGELLWMCIGGTIEAEYVAPSQDGEIGITRAELERRIEEIRNRMISEVRRYYEKRREVVRIYDKERLELVERYAEKCLKLAKKR